VGKNEGKEVPFGERRGLKKGVRPLFQPNQKKKKDRRRWLSSRSWEKMAGKNECARPAEIGWWEKRREKGRDLHVAVIYTSLRVSI